MVTSFGMTRPTDGAFCCAHLTHRGKRVVIHAPPVSLLFVHDFGRNHRFRIRRARRGDRAQARGSHGSPARGSVRTTSAGCGATTPTPAPAAMCRRRSTRSPTSPIRTGPGDMRCRRRSTTYIRWSPTSTASRRSYASAARCRGDLERRLLDLDRDLRRRLDRGRRRHPGQRGRPALAPDASPTSRASSRSPAPRSTPRSGTTPSTRPASPSRSSAPAPAPSSSSRTWPATPPARRVPTLPQLPVAQARQALQGVPQEPVRAGPDEQRLERGGIWTFMEQFSRGLDDESRVGRSTRQSRCGISTSRSRTRSCGPS